MLLCLIVGQTCSAVGIGRGRSLRARSLLLLVLLQKSLQHVEAAAGEETLQGVVVGVCRMRLL